MPPGRSAATPFASAAILIAALAHWVWPHPALAHHRMPAIAIIIDDMGNQLHEGLRATRLPGPVANAILPDTPYSKRLADAAYQAGKEVLLHLPMESVEGNRLGPGGVTLHMTHGQFERTVEHDIEAIPHVIGINNHMGSLITQHPGHMQWLMEEMHRHPRLYFVDSRTTVRTVAQELAAENAVRNSRRDIFLDDVDDSAAITAQFEHLVKLAKHTGSAVGIGHPHPATLAVLEAHLPKLLEREGVRLVPVSQIISLQQNEGRLWHASSSPSHRVAKRSKPLPSSICCAAPASMSYAPGLKTAR